MNTPPSERTNTVEPRKAKIRVGRIVFAAIAAEILGIIALVLIVALFGPSDKATAQAYAERLGFWVGPISGFLLCLLGGFWVARPLPNTQVPNGFFLGLAGAAIDVGIVIATGNLFPLHPVFALANIGRIVAGTIGGWLAKRLNSRAAIS